MGKCEYCGADVKSTDEKCPYCGGYSYQGSEKRYLEKLDDIRDDVEDLGTVAGSNVREELRDRARFVRKTLVALVAIALVVLAIVLVTDVVDKARDARDRAWLDENAPTLNALYDAADYDALLDAYWDALEGGDPIYLWRHYDFIDYYADFDWASRVRVRAAAGDDLDAYDLETLFQYECRCFVFENDKSLGAKDRAALEPLAKAAFDDLVARFDLSDKDIAGLRAKAKEGYIEYDYLMEVYERATDEM